MEPDQLHVPAFFRHSKGPSSEPQTQWFYFFTVATICVFEKFYKGIYFRSNCLGWFACYRTQFPTDLFKDPFLSSVHTLLAQGMVNCTCSYKNMQGGRGDLQSSAQRSSLQESQEARIDHPCVPAPKQFELLISVPVQCCAVLPFTQCWFDLFDLFDLAFLLDYVNAFQLGYSLDKVYQVGIAKRTIRTIRRDQFGTSSNS